MNRTLAEIIERSLPGVAAVIVAATAALTPSKAMGNVTDTLVADLRGAQEVPVVATGARGAGVFIINRATNTLSYRIVFWGLSSAETAAHIHGVAAPGVNAGILHNLPLGNPKVGTWNYPEAMENDIIAGRMYVNIHSVNFPGGEIRGQIGTHAAIINAAQEVPSNASAGTGWGVFVINTSANTLSYHIAFGGLTSAETAAHIHGISNHQVNSGILHTLPLGSPKVGVWNYPEAQEQDIIRGRTYVNIHTVNFPGGEIRGQVCNLVAVIDGLQEVPPSPSGGGGLAHMSLNAAGNALGYYIEFGGLLGPETAAHYHGPAPVGVNAGILHGLPLGSPKLGTWNMSDANETALLAGNTYINIHTTVFAGGEIRGQVRVGTKGPCPADLNGDGLVNGLDLGILLINWSIPPGTPGCGGAVPCPSDLNASGTVDGLDLGILLGAWGQCP